MYRLVLCLVLATSTLAIPRSATAAITDFYDTVDFVEISRRQPGFSAPSLVIRGIRVGESVPATRTYVFANLTGDDGLGTAMHCHRLAVLAMSKPGKFQFAISAPNVGNSDVGCRLTLVAP